MYNTKLVDDLNKRKLFKKHVYHNDNVEGYTWGDYDTMYYYTNENEDTWFLPKPKKEDKACQAFLPTLKEKTPKHTSCLPKPPSKTILTWNTYKNSKSAQTENPTCNGSTQTENQTCNNFTQTFPKLYLPDTRSNYNFEPFKTYLRL